MEHFHKLGAKFLLAQPLPHVAMELVQVPVHRGKEIIGGVAPKGLLLHAQPPAADPAPANQTKPVGGDALHALIAQMPVHIRDIFRQMNCHLECVTSLYGAA